MRRNFDVQINSSYWQQLDPPITIQSLKNGPVLFFITTSDTEIGQSIINEARVKAISYEQYFNLFYPLLVPFVSQATIQEMQGKWLFIYNKKEKIIESYISLPNRRDINVFVDLYEEAMEDYEGFSVYFKKLEYNYIAQKRHLYSRRLIGLCIKHKAATLLLVINRKRKKQLNLMSSLSATGVTMF